MLAYFLIINYTIMATLRNDWKATVNGIKPWQTVTIPWDKANMFFQYGFVEITPKVIKQEEKNLEDGNKLEDAKKAYFEYFEKEVPKNYKNPESILNAIEKDKQKKATAEAEKAEAKANLQESNNASQDLTADEALKDIDENA